eukprot:202012-Pyramimonas_sp.AAC.1
MCIRDSKKASDMSPHFEQCSVLTEKLDKYGASSALHWPFRITALKIIMAHAGEWLSIGNRIASKPYSPSFTSRAKSCIPSARTGP